MKLSVSFIDNGRISRQTITELFENYGFVKSVKMFRGMSQSHGRVLAIVDMKNESEALIAKELIDRTEVDGTQFRVSVSQDKIHGQKKVSAPSLHKKAPLLDDEGYDEEEEEREETSEDEYDRELLE